MRCLIVWKYVILCRWVVLPGLSWKFQHFWGWKRHESNNSCLLAPFWPRLAVSPLLFNISLFLSTALIGPVASKTGKWFPVLLTTCVWTTGNYEELSSSDESYSAPQRQRPARRTKGPSIHEGPQALAKITAIGMGRWKQSCCGEESWEPEGQSPETCSCYLLLICWDSCVVCTEQR